MKPNELNAGAAAAALRDGVFDAETLTRACLERIAEREPQLRAWAHLDASRALDQARAADDRRRAGAPLGPLHGLPVAIKDVIDTADFPTEHGSPLFRGRRPTQDADCVAALRRAGAIIIGKTVTTELANTSPAATRNPHDLERTPGGSSSGSAAAVADRQVPLALGTQTGGSMIRPASFCGICALKPTFGGIPRGGVLLQSHSLDTVGVYGRAADDLALLFGALNDSGNNDINDNATVTPRLALLETPAWPHVEPAARRALLDFGAALGDTCRNETGALPAAFGRILEYHQTVMNAENLFYYGEFLQRPAGQLSDEMRARLYAARDVTAVDYIRALQARDELYAAVDDLLGRYDAILCAASTGPAPLGFSHTGSPICNGLWTYLGVPCVALPLLSVEGMPFGVQLVGRRGADAALLAVAARLQRHARPHNRPLQ